MGKTGYHITASYLAILKLKSGFVFFFYWILYIFLSTWVLSIMDFDYSLSIEFISNDFEVQMMK